MASINKVILIGNLGADPVIRYLPSGDAVTNVRIATSDRYRSKKTNESKSITEWHRVTFFGRLAEIVSEYGKKGTSMYIEGRIRTRKYQAHDGTNRYSTDIIADNMQLLGKRIYNEKSDVKNKTKLISISDKNDLHNDVLNQSNSFVLSHKNYMENNDDKFDNVNNNNDNEDDYEENDEDDNDEYDNDKGKLPF